MFTFSFKVLEILFKIWIFVRIRCKYDSIAIFYNGFACDKDFESRIKSVVYSELMAVKLEGAVGAIVNKNS
jgi:hypothetical protein